MYTHVETRRQLMGVSSLPLCGFQGLTQVARLAHQAFLTTELSLQHCPSFKAHIFPRILGC